MTRLYAQLESLEAADDSISVAIVGVGRMGRSIALASEHVAGIEVTALADVRTERAIAVASTLQDGTGDIAVVEDPREGDEARASGQVVVTADARLPAQLADIDVVIGATGAPNIGAMVAHRSILNGKHVVMLTDETDAAIGPYLSRLATEAGVVYAGAAGDEPGAIMELYDFARASGFEVVAAGKGKNNPLDRAATPATLQADAERKGLSPEVYTAFVDGTNSMLEMTMVANATGLTVDTRGLHGPEVDGVEALPAVFARTDEGGILSESGVVDYALGGDVAPGVFVVVRTEDETVQEDLEYLKLGSGPNYVLHRAYHIPTIEPLLTGARAVIDGRANLVPQRPVVDTISVAKQDLTPGEEIDGIGGATVYGLAERAAVAADEDLVPISLIEGATVERPLGRGEPITYGDVTLQENELYHLRRLQDEQF